MKWWVSVVVLRLAGVLLTKPFYVFWNPGGPSPWNLGEVDWGMGCGRHRVVPSSRVPFKKELSWLLKALSANSLQLSALSRYFLYCRAPIPPRALLPGVDSMQGLIVGQLLRPSMFSPPALKSPLCPRAPRWGWPGVACWVCITEWFLPHPASTVLIPDQYPAC